MTRTIKFRDKKVGAIKSQLGYTFNDTLAVLQKKGLTLLDSEELSDLINQPEFGKLRAKRANDSTYVADAFVYTPSGEILVVSAERNPLIKRYRELVDRFNEFSFPDNLAYIDTVEKTIAAVGMGMLRKSHDRQLGRKSTPDPSPLPNPVAALKEYAKKHDTLLLSPKGYSPEIYHPADRVKAKEGEPYLISRIRDESRVCCLFGTDESLTDQGLSDLINIASTDAAKARESGVLLVPRKTIYEFDPLGNEQRIREYIPRITEKGLKRIKETPYFSLINIPVKDLPDHPIPAFLFGDNVQRMGSYLREKGPETLPILIIDKRFMQTQEKGIAKCTTYNLRTPEINAAEYGMRFLYHAQVFGKSSSNLG